MNAAAPVRVNRNRCEGKGDCLRVCPQGVFTLGVLPLEERQGLKIGGLLKGYAHGWRQALLARPEACTSCGLCVAACPERAISLLPRRHNEPTYVPTAAD